MPREEDHTVLLLIFCYFGHLSGYINATVILRGWGWVGGHWDETDKTKGNEGTNVEGN